MPKFGTMRLTLVHKLPAADLPLDQAPFVIEGQFYIDALETAPLASQSLAAVIEFFLAAFVIDAQIIIQINARPDSLAATVALSHHPICVGFGPGCYQLGNFLENAHTPYFISKMSSLHGCRAMGRGIGV